MTDTKALTSDSPLSTDNPDQVVEAYADRLMDDLFGGVERALEGDLEALDAAPEEAPEVPELTLNFSEGGLPAVLLSGTAELSPVHLPSVLTTATPVEAASDTATQTGWQRYWSINRALLGAAGISLLATLALWFHQRQQIPVVVTVPTPANTVGPEASPNAEFLEYLQRSLEVIGQQVGETASVAANPGVPEVSIPFNGNVPGLPPIGTNTLPPTALPNTVASANGGSINVIERVYIPYQAAQVPAPTAPAPTTSNTLPPSSVSAVPASIHTLVGVLELGDRSAALFEIDGVPQRVYIGERIGSSGWSLVSVANEEAMIRRNGEVRSIYIGQQF